MPGPRSARPGWAARADSQAAHPVLRVHHQGLRRGELHAGLRRRGHDALGGIAPHRQPDVVGIGMPDQFAGTEQRDGQSR